jgi:hypothetical protein
MRSKAPLKGHVAAWPILALLAAWAAFAPGASAQDGRRKQDLLFDEVPERSVGDAPFGVAVKATSGLPVSLEIISGPAVIDGKKIRLTGEPGLVVVRASQAGNPEFLPAIDAERAFTVRPKPSGPVIHIQPTGQNVAMGEAIFLALDAAGEPPPAYQWRRDGVPITGATGRAFTITVANPSDAGAYDVVVSNASGSVTSERVRVSVGKRHQALIFQTTGSSATAGQSISLIATATSGLPVQFQIQSGPGFLSGNILTCPGGMVVVQATQPGDSTYEAAVPAQQTFIFNPNPGVAHP